MANKKKSPDLGSGYAGNAQKKLTGRAAQLAAQEEAALGGSKKKQNGTMTKKKGK